MSIFSAEAEAILKAMHYIERQNHKKFCTMSDSKSVLTSLSTKGHYSIKHPTIVNILRKYIELEERNIAVKFYWIKGHVMITPNEIVNTLAQDAISKGTYTQCYIYWRDYIPTIRKDLLKEWNRRWDMANNQGATQYAIIHPVISERSWHRSQVVSRLMYSTIARLKFGHGQTPAHLYRLGIIESAACSCGTEVADANHIVLECSKHRNNREDLMRDLIRLKVPQPTNLIEILKTNDILVYKALLNFLTRSKVKI